MQRPRDQRTGQPAGKAEGGMPAGAEPPDAVPTVPAPPLDEGEWDPARDPMEGLDPAAWWGG